MNSLTFVIPALDEERHLQTCLAAIGRLNNAASIAIDEVIVVDNDSTDGTSQIADQGGATVVHVAPAGFVGRARNLGVERAKGSLIAFVDADCELPRDWLTACEGHFSDLEVLAVGCPQALPDEAASWVEKTWSRLTRVGSDQAPRQVLWLPTFNMIVRRSSFVETGGFNEQLESCEDSDFGYRLAKDGKLILEPGTSVRHGGASGSLLEFVRREIWRSRGTLASVKSRGVLVQELPSLVIPAVFAAALMALLLVLAIRPVLPVGTQVILLLAAPIGLLPTALVLRRRVYPLPDLGLFLRSWWVAGAYLLGRGLGLVIPGSRVGRTAE